MNEKEKPRRRIVEHETKSRAEGEWRDQIQESWEKRQRQVTAAWELRLSVRDEWDLNNPRIKIEKFVKKKSIYMYIRLASWVRTQPANHRVEKFWLNSTQTNSIVRFGLDWTGQLELVLSPSLDSWKMNTHKSRQQCQGQITFLKNI